MSSRVCCGQVLNITLAGKIVIRRQFIADPVVACSLISPWLEKIISRLQFIADPLAAASRISLLLGSSQNRSRRTTTRHMPLSSYREATLEEQNNGACFSKYFVKKVDFFKTDPHKCLYYT